MNFSEILIFVSISKSLGTQLLSEPIMTGVDGMSKHIASEGGELKTISRGNQETMRGAN